MRLEPVTTCAALILQHLMVERESPDKHPDLGAGQSIGGYPAVFQRLSCGMQQEALLWIERVRLAG